MTTVDGVIQGVAKTHVLWEIPKYFSKQKADFHYISPDFHFLGSTWSLRIYPNGERVNKSVEFVGLYVRRKKPYEKHGVYFKIGIVCGNELICEGSGVYISKQPVLFGWDKFMERKSLESYKFRGVPKGTLTIRFVGELLHDTVFHAASQTKILDGANALSRDFETLLSSEQASDVEIRVKSRVFRAHRLILEARSTVFAAMFKYDMKERNTGSIDIEDCEPAAFQEFLSFMYTGKIGNLCSENVCDIFSLANKYDLSDLKQICIDFMEENLCLNMVCNVLSVADKFNVVGLKKSAQELFLKNRKVVTLSESWIPFIAENPELAIEILLDAL